MSGWSRPARALAVLAVMAAGPVGRAGTPVAPPAPAPAADDPSRLRAEADAAEQCGQWDRACGLYLRAYLADPSADVRDRVRQCLRRSRQVDRHHDPAFRAFVRSLPVADALGVYAEVVGKLADLHPDREAAAPEALFARGLDELDRALGDPTFRAEHLPAADPGRVDRLRRAVRERWPGRRPATPQAARQAARELVREAAEAGLRDPSAAVLELIHGAAAGLDEFTRYLPPTDPPAAPDPTPTVTDVRLLADHPGVGYIRLTGFREYTPDLLDDAVGRLAEQGMRGLVLDVRGNPGGLFGAAVLVAQKFLPGGAVVGTRGPAPEFADRVFGSDAGLAAWAFPVVLLTDTRTMSAAEVVAAALKDHGRAYLVGTPTFGKGVVQWHYPVRAGADGKGGVLALTVAALYGPRGEPLAGGVTPHRYEPDPRRQLELAADKAAELIGGR